MNLRINNVLELQLVNEDTQSFIDLFATLKDSIILQEKKIGFKKNNTLSLTLDKDTIDFVLELCDSNGILSDSEIQEQETQNKETQNKEDKNKPI